MSTKDEKAGLAAQERNKAKKLFVTNNRRKGRTGMVKHKIDTGVARPIKQAPKSIRLAKRNEVKELVEEMKRSGVSEPFSGSWSSPIVVVKKENGSLLFERLMEHILKVVHWKTCPVYLNDIIVMDRNFAEHLKNLGEVLQQVTTAGLKFSVKKCALFQ